MKTIIVLFFAIFSISAQAADFTISLVPNLHTHEISEVNGLQSALSDKASNASVTSALSLKADTGTAVVFKGAIGAIGLPASQFTIMSASVVKDSSNSWNGTEFIVPKDGDYEMVGYIQFVTNNYAVNNRQILRGYKNNTPQNHEMGEGVSEGTSNITRSVSGSTIFTNCVAGDRLTMRGYSERVGGTATTSGSITIKLLGGVN